jgi:hypothetical protein
MSFFQKFQNIQSELFELLPRDVLIHFLHQRDDVCLYLKTRMEIGFESIVSKVKQISDSYMSQVNFFPSKRPMIWYTVGMLGDYGGCPLNLILSDTKRFVTYSLARSYFLRYHKWPKWMTNEVVCNQFELAYFRCANDVVMVFPELFSKLEAKCLQWLTIIDNSIPLVSGWFERLNYGNGLRPPLDAHKSVFMCLQVVDDWNDGLEDKERGHWNLWQDERAESAVMLSLLAARTASLLVQALKPSILRDMLALQLTNTIGEICKIARQSLKCKV